jgi:hypothetical protein
LIAPVIDAFSAKNQELDSRSVGAIQRVAGRGFVEYVAPRTDAHLVYEGPSVSAVTDDPEGSEVLDEARDFIAGMDRAGRERVHLACLPMDDLGENAAIVNALQRRADVGAEEHRGGFRTHRR